MRTTMLIMFVSALLTLPSMAFAQSDFPVPERYRLRQKDDYKEYEKDYLNCVKWLAEHPVDDSDEYKEVLAFTVKWCEGTPYVTILLTDLFADGIEDDPTMLVAFMNGWAKYVIETGDEDNYKAYLAGMNHALDMYENPVCSIEQNKFWNKMVKSREKGDLEKIVRKEVE